MFFGYNAGLNANPVASNNIYISSLGASGDSGTIRIGDSANQTAAYLAGVSGVSISGGQPVVINSNGQLGTGSAGLGVTSFNGRTGAVIPESGDYNFSLLSGTLGSSQLSGSYSASITLSNASNSLSGSSLSRCRNCCQRGIKRRSLTTVTVLRQKRTRWQAQLKRAVSQRLASLDPRKLRSVQACRRPRAGVKRWWSFTAATVAQDGARPVALRLRWARGIPFHQSGSEHCMIRAVCHSSNYRPPAVCYPDSSS